MAKRVPKSFPNCPQHSGLSGKLVQLMALHKSHSTQLKLWSAHFVKIVGDRASPCDTPHVSQHTARVLVDAFREVLQGQGATMRHFSSVTTRRSSFGRHISRKLSGTGCYPAALLKFHSLPLELWLTHFTNKIGHRASPCGTPQVSHEALHLAGKRRQVTLPGESCQWFGGHQRWQEAAVKSLKVDGSQLEEQLLQFIP